MRREKGRVENRLNHPSQVKAVLGALSRFVKVASVVSRE